MIDHLYYAQGVLSGEIVAGEWIKKSCERYLSWLERDDMYFDFESVERYLRFASKLKHFTGEMNGKCFKLEEWQKWIIYNIFGFRWKSTNRRVIKNVLVTMARKNGKSFFAASIALYCLICDGENNAEVELVANNRKQAHILFEMCSNLIEGIDKKGKLFKRFRDTIKFPYTKSKIQVLSSDSSGLDGFNSHLFILDEAHEQPNPSPLYNVMKSSQGARTQPLGVIISTSGFHLNGFLKCYEDVAKEVVEGLKEDDTLFAAIYQMDENDRWDDENLWVKSNPNLGVSVSKEYLKEQIQQAKNNPSLEVGVKTKNLNLWCQSSEVWINNDLVLENSEKISFDFFKDKVTYMGIDLSAVSDLTACAYMTVEDEKIYFKVDYYLPETALEDNVNSNMYKMWKRQGYLKTTPSNVTDYDYILKDILEVGKDALIDSIHFDSWNSSQFNQNATAEGLNMCPFSQSIGNFNRATKEFERLMRMGRIVLDYNPITLWCIQNCTIKEDYNGNAKPVKTIQMQKIDGVIACLQALGGYLAIPQYNNTIYTI